MPMIFASLVSLVLHKKRGSGVFAPMHEIHQRFGEIKCGYNIKSFQGILGDVSSTNVQIGDYSSIHHALKEKGVSQKERNELENLLDIEGQVYV
jgi:hypothetical protein